MKLEVTTEPEEKRSRSGTIRIVLRVLNGRESSLSETDTRERTNPPAVLPLSPTVDFSF